MSSTKASLKGEPLPGQALVLSFITAGFAELVFESLQGGSDPKQAVARILVLFLSLYTVHRLAGAAFREYRPRLKDLITLHIILIGAVCLVATGRFLALALSDYVTQGSWGGLGPESLHFAIPFAVGGLIIQAVLGLQFGLVYSLSLALLVGLYTVHLPSSIFVPYVFISNLIACLSMAHFRSRSAYIKAGFNVSLVAFLFALAAVVAEPQLTLLEVIVRLLGALLAGVLCTFIAAGVTPVLEYLGGYVTDMRLIEMATLDHPLLKDLSLQSPGTWNHSMVIGMMVESAAAEIGANPVLARVGAYFHDIGKMKKPAYFVENQDGENRHNKLSTSMSALIIRSHVKDGIELARKHKLPEAIIDMIPQHHGTSLIEYFYQKALKEAEESEETVEVDRNLYTYPGPRPQTREAGLLMLADKIESSTRTLAEPTLDRIQGLVQKMINKVFASGELDECDLTLRDLHVIAACFTRVLNSIYHQRIAYSEPAEKVTEKAAASAERSEAADKGEAKTKNGTGGAKELEGRGAKKSSEETAAKAGTKEDLKRLGM